VIRDVELVEMIKDSATEQLPIAVMTVKEMRQFAEKVAMDCIRIIQMEKMGKQDMIRVIKDRYATAKH